VKGMEFIGCGKKNWLEKLSLEMSFSWILALSIKYSLA